MRHRVHSQGPENPRPHIYPALFGAADEQAALSVPKRKSNCRPTALHNEAALPPTGRAPARATGRRHRKGRRSEEHTSELQSLMRISYAVFCLKKKNNIQIPHTLTHAYPTPDQHNNTTISR